MNQEQVAALFRTVLQVAGGILATKGYMSAGDAATLSNELMLAAGAMLTLGTTAWGVYRRRNEALIEAAKTVEKAEQKEQRIEEKRKSLGL